MREPLVAVQDLRSRFFFFNGVLVLHQVFLWARFSIFTNLQFVVRVNQNPQNIDSILGELVSILQHWVVNDWSVNFRANYAVVVSLFFLTTARTPLIGWLVPKNYPPAHPTPSPPSPTPLALSLIYLDQSWQKKKTQPLKRQRSSAQMKIRSADASLMPAFFTSTSLLVSSRRSLLSGGSAESSPPSPQEPCFSLYMYIYREISPLPGWHFQSGSVLNSALRLAALAWVSRSRRSDPLR